MGSYQQGVLTELLQAVYQAKGITQEPRTWREPLPTFQALWALLTMQEAEAKGRARESLASLHVKFRPLAVGGLFSRRRLIPLPPRDWVRVDLSGLPHELQYLAVDLLLRQLFWTMVLEGQAPRLRGTVILDEAKLILARSKSDPLAILNRLAILTLVASIPPLRDAWIGVVVAHLLCDALSPTGIPVFLEGGQNLVLFSGRLRVGSPMELALAAGILLLALLTVQPGSEGNFIRRHWGKLYEERAIDKREYLEHRFSIF